MLLSGPSWLQLKNGQLGPDNNTANLRAQFLFKKVLKPYFIVFFGKQCFVKSKLGPDNNTSKGQTCEVIIWSMFWGFNSYFLVHACGDFLSGPRSFCLFIVVSALSWHSHFRFWLFLCCPLGNVDEWRRVSQNRTSLLDALFCLEPYGSKTPYTTPSTM